STWSKLSRSISINLRSLTRGSGSSGWPEKSPRTPRTKGSSLFSIAPPISTSYVICTLGGRTRSSLCCMLSFFGIASYSFFRKSAEEFQVKTGPLGLVLHFLLLFLHFSFVILH